MSSESITFIINPIAGGRDKNKFVRKLRKTFDSSSRNVNIFFTLHQGHAFDMAAAEVSNGTAMVVAVGGDGTINEVARALTGTGTILGVIPSGSGNGFARHFGIPLSPGKALQVIKNGEPVNIDTARVNERTFMCTSGMGFDAETGYYFSKHSKRGFLSYLLSFLRVYRNYRPEQYRIRINGRIMETEAFFINVANISQFGYHFYVAPAASAQDGLLDLIVVRKFPKWKGIFLAIRSFSGTFHNSRYVYSERAEELTILEPGGSKIIHIDGDPAIFEGQVHYRLIPGALKVMLPGPV